jgi:thiamine biosynthesis lipoprotein
LDVSLRVAPGTEGPAREALGRVFETVRRLEAVANRFDPESAVSGLNERAGGGPVAVGSDLHAMLSEANLARTRTRGAFDVTVGPLVELWTRAAERGRAPDERELADARARVGRPVQLDADGRASLERAGMSVDLGGLAKGFALDRVVQELLEAGFGRSLLSFGRSSIWAGGQPWKLRVESDEGPLAVVVLQDLALSMSSSLSQSSEIDGVRYGHVIDPRSGQALRARRMALVVTESATRAEILSTALLVLGEADAREVLADLDAEAWVREEDGREWQTAGWLAATLFEGL